MNIPQLCKNCFKFHNETILSSCDVCSKLQFLEKHLCDLLRFNKKGFACYAYKPKLQLVNSKQKSNLEIEQEASLLTTQRNKWQTTYYVQEQKENPNQIQFKLKYHIVILTSARSAILSEKYYSSFSKIFSNTAKSIDNTVTELMWISSDHLHLYIDSSPDFSIDEIFQTVSSNSERIILMKHPELNVKKKNLWENSYFVETLG
jgi:putative transposase